jgi:hypothetical protein
VKINGERHYLWRAVDHEGEVLEVVVTKKRVSIPDQNGSTHRRDIGQWLGPGVRLGACARHIADA